MEKLFKKRLLLILVVTVLALSMSACGGVVAVNALDYELENAIYTGQRSPEGLDAPADTPAPVDTPATTEAPESTEAPVPTEAPESTDAPIPTDVPAPANTPEPTESPAPTEGLINTDRTLYSYTVIAQMENGKRLDNVRISLYSADSLMYSAVTDSNGTASWSLLGGQSYNATAELNGYDIVRNDSKVAALDANTTVTVVMAESQSAEGPQDEKKEQEETPCVEELPSIYDVTSFQMYVDSLNQARAELIPLMTCVEDAYRDRLESAREASEGASVLKSTEESGPEGFFSSYSYQVADDLTIDNWGEIIAVYIASETDAYAEIPLGLYNIPYNGWNGLSDVADDMLQLSLLNMPDGRYITYKNITWQEMAVYYDLSPERTEFLKKLMEPEFQQTIAVLCGDEKVVSYEASVDEILSGLSPELSEQRQSVIESACSLVGKVGYFWGGKYNALGWCDNWGTPMTVTAEGSDSTGQQRSFGLDCSGFVSWSFINGFSDKQLLSLIGNGTSNQWAASTALDWVEGQPGDLVFLNSPNSGSGNHVGIIVRCVGDGNYIVIHCAGGGVAVADAWGVGFNYVRRPNIYG